jgi:hypothetical protein
LTKIKQLQRLSHGCNLLRINIEAIRLPPICLGGFKMAQIVEENKPEKPPRGCIPLPGGPPENPRRPGPWAFFVVAAVLLAIVGAVYFFTSRNTAENSDVRIEAPKEGR